MHNQCRVRATWSWAEEAFCPLPRSGPLSLAFCPAPCSPPSPQTRTASEFNLEMERLGSKTAEVALWKASKPWMIGMLFWSALMYCNPKIKVGAPSSLGGRLWLLTSYLSTSETLVAALTPLWPLEAAARPFPQLSRSEGLDRGFSWRDSRQKYSSGLSISWRHLQCACKRTVVKVGPHLILLCFCVCLCLHVLFWELLLSLASWGSRGAIN